MSDEIKVGNRVRGQMSGKEYKALGICGNWVWILAPGCTEPITVANCYLTLISPEPVTLTPKYAVGQEVESPAGKRTICQVFVAYRMREYAAWWAEGQLQPVPEPCPTCKGSGKASE